MKKNVIALILSVVLASGSLGPVPAMAAETAEAAETTENVPEEKIEASEAAGADAEGGSAETEEKAVEEDPEETDASSADEADETGEEVPEDPQITETDDAAEEGAGRTDEIVAADATAEEADPEAVTEETAESGAEDVPTVQDENEISVQDDMETADKDIKEEDTAEEPSNAEIAVNSDVKDEASDLKVAEDAEKLKGGKWKEVTKTVHHEEKGHYETETVQTGTRTVVDEEGWDEPVYDTACVCNVCGYTCYDDDEIADHMVDEHDADGSWYTTEKQVGSKHHDAVTHEEPVYEEREHWVVDQDAWDEQVKTGTYQYIVNGKPVKNKLAAIGDETYYFDANGIAVTGWKDVNGSRMYFGSDRKMKTGLLSLSGKKY